MATTAASGSGSRGTKATRRRAAPKTARRGSADGEHRAREGGARTRAHATHEAPAASHGAREAGGARVPRMLTPEQAIELYKANARLALDVIDAAIEGAERVRRKQLEGEEQMRTMSRKHARAAAEAGDAQSLVALGRGAAAEAMESSMRYWGEMFDLIVEIQKRLFTLIEEQTRELPGAREARAAMALLPDLSQMQKVVSAMQGVVSSGSAAFDSMQRVMGDVTRIAQQALPGGRR